MILLWQDKRKPDSLRSFSLTINDKLVHATREGLRSAIKNIEIYEITVCQEWKPGCAAGCCVVILHVLCIIRRLNPKMFCVMESDLLACDDFLFLCMAFTILAAKQWVESHVWVWMIEKICREMKATDQLWTLVTFIFPLCLPGLLLFFVSLQPVFCSSHHAVSPGRSSSSSCHRQERFEDQRQATTPKLPYIFHAHSLPCTYISNLK